MNGEVLTDQLGKVTGNNLEDLPKRWMIDTDSEREPGKSVLSMRDDDDDDVNNSYLN